MQTQSTATAPNISTKRDQVDQVLAYCESVLAGEEVAGPHVRNACRRHLRDLESGAERGLYWDLAAAQRVFGFFRKVLRLSDGQFDGLPFELQGAQLFIVGSLFGWKRGLPNQDHSAEQLAALPRRFRRAYIEMGKGNGKSPLVGGIGLYAMMSDGEPGAEIYAAGARKEQAGILFRDAVRMYEQSPLLLTKIKPSGRPPHIWNLAALQHPQNGSFFRPISRESGRSGSGPRPHFALVDELHEHPDRSVVEMLERGFKSRRQPMLLMITNSGADRASICFEEHMHACQVAAGDKEDDTSFSFVCSLDEDDDPLADPECWKKANPMLDVILTREYLAGVCKQAKDIPGKQNMILRLHFCCWTGAETAWIKKDVWDAAQDATLDLAQFEGQDEFVGLDLSSTRDLTGAVRCFIEGYTEPTTAIDKDGNEIEVGPKPKYVLFPHGYTPEVGLRERGERDREEYHLWVDGGHLTATPGPVVRYEYIAHDLVQDQQRFNLVAVAYDKHNYNRFEMDAQDMGADLPCFEHGQGFGQKKGKDAYGEDAPLLWMPASVETFENAIVEGRMRIKPSPAFTAAMSGARFQLSAGGTMRRFAKGLPGRRIDILIAAVMAVGAATELKGDQMKYVEGSLMVAA
jgi:phage terminase large subunit-like protein